MNYQGPKGLQDFITPGWLGVAILVGIISATNGLMFGFGFFGICLVVSGFYWTIS